MFNLKAAFRDMQRDLAPLSLGAQQGPTARPAWRMVLGLVVLGAAAGRP
jgi:hypothetical protein